MRALNITVAVLFIASGILVAGCGGEEVDLEVGQHEQAVASPGSLGGSTQGFCGLNAHEIPAGILKSCACNSCYTGDPFDGCLKCAVGCARDTWNQCVPYTPPANPCQGVTCGGNAHCVGGSCACHDGYAGDAKAGCTPKPCADKAFRLLGSGPAVCVCPAGTWSANPESDACKQEAKREESYFEDQKTVALDGVKGTVRVDRQGEIRLLKNGANPTALATPLLSNGCGPRSGMHLLSWFGLSPQEQDVKTRMKTDSWHPVFGFWGTSPVYYRSAIESYLNESFQNVTTTTTCPKTGSPMLKSPKLPLEGASEVAAQEGAVSENACPAGTVCQPPGSGGECTNTTTSTPIYAVHRKDDASFDDLRKALLHGAPVAVLLVLDSGVLHWALVSAIDDLSNVYVVNNQDNCVGDTCSGWWSANEFMKSWSLDLFFKTPAFFAGWTLETLSVLFQEYCFHPRTMIFVTPYGAGLNDSTEGRFFSGLANQYPGDANQACRKYLDEQGSKYNYLYKLAVDNQAVPGSVGSPYVSFTCRVYDGTQPGLITAQDQGTAYKAGQTVVYYHVGVASTPHHLACEWVVNGALLGRYPCHGDSYLEKPAGASSVSFRIHPATDGSAAQHVSF